MQDYPTISVIIVNHNRLALLGKCIDSLKAQSYPAEKTEIILVDNCSTDGSPNFVRDNYPEITVLRNDDNLGFAKPHNQAAKVSNSEYLAFINNDMRADRNWLFELVGAATHNGVPCVGGKILSSDGSKIDFVGGGMNFCGYGFQLEEGFKEGNSNTRERDILFACGGSMLINRRLYQEVGGFDNDYFAYFEDVDFGWRLWILGHCVMFSPRAITYHRSHSTSSILSERKKYGLYARNALCTIIKNYEEKYYERVVRVALALAMERVSPLVSTEDSSPSENAVHPPPYSSRLGLIRDYYRKHTALDTVRKSVRYGAKRLGSIVTRMIMPESAMLSSYQLGNFDALRDLLSQFDSIMSKRTWIQSARTRSDDEIVSLFIDPFYPESKVHSYLQRRNSLIEKEGLHSLFTI